MNATFNLHPTLDALRRERTWSMRQLYAAAVVHLPSLTQSRLTRYSLGYAHPTWSEVCALALALGISPERLALLPEKPVAPPAIGPDAESPHPAAPVPAQVVTSTPAPAFPVPPCAIPDIAGKHADLVRSILGTELKNATAALHFPKLPAKLWAGWRAYEQTVRKALNSLPAT